MIDFTKDELFEIEKHFDLLAGSLANRYSVRLLQLLDKHDKKEQVSKILDEHIRSFDTFRTISAKCERRRRE